MARASPWTSTKVRVLWVNVGHWVLCRSWRTPPRRPARPRPRRAAAPAPVVSSLLAALIRTPLSCRPADLTLTRAIERVATARSIARALCARRHRHRAHRVRSGVGAVGRRVLLAVARRRRGALRRAPRSTHDGVPPCGQEDTLSSLVRAWSGPVAAERTRIAMRINIPNTRIRFQYACSAIDSPPTAVLWLIVQSTVPPD
jgi:hypothetical protein